jgi:hypothetical protein
MAYREFNMSRAETLEPWQKAYWQVVETCLIRFHHFEPKEAVKAATGFRKGLYEAMSNPLLLYHEEAFYTACDIADHDLEPDDFGSEYEEILTQVKSRLAS